MIFLPKYYDSPCGIFVCIISEILNRILGGRIYILYINLNRYHRSTENAVDSCLSIGSSLDTGCELNPSSIETQQSLGYYKSSSSEDYKNIIHKSARDLAVCINQSDTSVNTCSLRCIKQPFNETKLTYFDCRTKSQMSSLSDLNFDIDSQLCESVASLSTDNCSTDTPNVDSGYMHTPISTENIEQSLT